MKINSITNIRLQQVFAAQPYAKHDSNITSPIESDNKSIETYLYSSAVINMAHVKKTENRKSNSKSEYSNNLRSMIKNNESVMIAIAPRLFTAKDLNGDEKISLSHGEKQGTLLSAIERLDELKADGFNTIHILPIHPAGLTKAMGTAGSLYSPKSFVTKDGHLSIDPLLIEKDDPRTPDEQFKAFIDECHKRDIKVMLDLPSCASVDMYVAEPELMAFGRNGEDKTPQGWADIRMFEPWDDETKRTLNPKLLEMHKQYVDACIELGLDGIRADVARAKPTEFWNILIPYSRQKNSEFAWLAETYTYECASPQVNMPYDRPEDLLRAGFDEYYGQYHIFHEWNTSKAFTDYVIENLDMSHRLPAGRTCIGSFMTHDDKSSMIHGGENYSNMTTIIQSTIPMCNPYFVDGFQTGDYYNYSYSNKMSDESFTDNFCMDHHPYQLDIFNLSRKPGGNNPDMERVLRETLKMRNENKDVFADKNSSFIVLNKENDKNDQIIAFARHNNGRTVLVVANKNPNRHISGSVLIPGLKSTQKFVNMAPNYGDLSEFQAEDGKLNLILSPADAYVFEIDTPNIEKDCKGNVYKQKVCD